jgi:hypothetical protein
MSDKSPEPLTDMGAIAQFLTKEPDSGLLARVLASRLAEKKDWTDPSEAQSRAQALKELFTTYNQAHGLSVGQIVCWKKGMKNRKRPAYGEPCIVIHLLETPVYDKEADSGSSYFQEPLNIVLGVLDVDGDFTFWYFDKSRFEPVSTT